MTLDRIENGEYVLHNTFFDDDSETNVSNDTAVLVFKHKNVKRSKNILKLNQLSEFDKQSRTTLTIRLFLKTVEPTTTTER